jgi:hypothetical protein
VESINSKKKFFSEKNMAKKLKNYESFGKCEETVEKILFRKNGTKIRIRKD